MPDNMRTILKGSPNTSQLHGGRMQTHTSLLLGSIGILVLVGCSKYDNNNYGSASGYLVNGIAVADVDANGKPDILGMASTDLGCTPTQGYVSPRFHNPTGTFAF